MKTIAAALIVLVSFSGKAQENSILPLPKYHNKEYNLKSLRSIKPNSQAPQYLEKLNNLNTRKPGFYKKSPTLFSLPDSSKDYVVATLKQDGMPCIIPDMRKFNNMPNVVKHGLLLRSGKEPGQIPNPLNRQQKSKG